LYKNKTIRRMLSSSNVEEVLLLSIKPKFSEMIKNGLKTVELRKRKPKRLTKFAIVYESSPKQVASFLIKIESVDYSPVSKIWKQYGKQACIDKRYFNEYYSNADCGAAIIISSVLKLQKEVDFDRLSKHEISPPQDYRYVPKALAMNILGL